MDMSLKKLQQATMPYMSFVDQFHKDVVGNGQARRNKDGTITTVFSTGVPFKNKIYEMPGYDPLSGKKLSEDQVREKYLPMLESGDLQKDYGDFGIPVGNYRTILELYQQYKKNSDYGNVPDGAIKFNFMKKRNPDG